jgi:hypothetical protein
MQQTRLKGPQVHILVYNRKENHQTVTQPSRILNPIIIKILHSETVIYTNQINEILHKGIV